LLITFVVITLLFLTHWVMRNTSVRAVAEKTPWWLLSIVWSVMLFLLVIAQTNGEQFIYFQF
ncbi:MAG: MBOAT family protein, partial [Robiginitalea sp.]